MSDNNPPKYRHISGIYFRSGDRENPNVCFEELPREYQIRIINAYDDEALKRLIKMLAETCREAIKAGIIHSQPNDIQWKGTGFYNTPSDSVDDEIEKMNRATRQALALILADDINNIAKFYELWKI